MTVKEWLNRSRTIEKELKQLKELKERAYNLAYGGSIDISNEKVQTSKRNSTEDKFAAYADYSKQVDDMTAELIRYRGKVLRAINQVHNKTYKMLLVERYINCKTWEQISEDMHINIRWVYRLSL